MRPSLILIVLLAIALPSIASAENSQVYVVGAGPVGVLFGTQLARDKKNDVTMVKRGAEPPKPYVQISEGKNAPDVTLNQAHWDAIDQFPHGAVIIVAVKSFDLAETWKTLAKRIDGSQTVVLTQNGIDVAKEAPGLANYPSLVRALVLTGVKLENIVIPPPAPPQDPSLPNVAPNIAPVTAASGTMQLLNVAGQRALRLASNNEFGELKAIEKLFASAQFQVVSAELNIAQAEWMKALLNLYINGPTAVFDCTIGEVLDHPNRFILAERLLIEAVAVARNEGIHISEGDVNAVRKKARELAAHKTSMQQDVARKAPTEKKWLYGAVKAKAEAVGMNVPYTSRVLEMLEKRENGHHPFHCEWDIF